MCVLDMLDPSASYTVVTQGLCLPTECSAEPVQNMLSQLAECNLKIGDYLNHCVKADYMTSCMRKHTGTGNATVICDHSYNTIETGVSKAWDLFNSLNAQHQGPVEFHCGDHEVSHFSPGESQFGAD